MGIDINAEIVRTYEPGSDPQTPDFNEIHNQQLNEALQAGTVEGILMKTGYVAQYDHNVVIKRDIAGFITRADLENYVQNVSFDFKGYDNVYDPIAGLSGTQLQIKHNLNYNGSHPSMPTTTQVTKPGEIAVDNFDGALYLRAYGPTHSNPSNTPSPRIVKVDAGTVNGFVVQRDVFAPGSGSGDADAFLNKQEMVNLVNGAFAYDASLNKLTIRKVSTTDPV